MDAPGPLGLSWAGFVLLGVPLLLVLSGASAVVRRSEITSPRLVVVLVAAVAAGMWTLFTAAAPVRVPVAGYPEGSMCIDAGYAPVDWSSDCGRAFAQHLVVSGAPTLVMLAVTTGVASSGFRRRRRTSAAESSS